MPFQDTERYRRGGTPAMAKQPVGGSRPAGAYSPGIVAEGRFVYVSGQGALRDGVVTGDTIEEQTRIVLANVTAVLESAGATLADVVQCRVFLADAGDFRAMDGVYAQAFPHPPPSPNTMYSTMPPP